MILDETVTCPILPEQSSSARPAAYNLLPPLAVRASLLSASPLAPIQDNGEWREKWRELGELASRVIREAWVAAEREGGRPS